MINFLYGTTEYVATNGHRANDDGSHRCVDCGLATWDEVHALTVSILDRRRRRSRVSNLRPVRGGAR